MGFTISYYEGEGVGLIEIGKYTFSGIQKAIDFCLNHNIPLSIVNITQWDNSVTDLYGVGEIVGQCNLEECQMENVTDLEDYL